jgi:hypothetical protein
MWANARHRLSAERSWFDADRDLIGWRREQLVRVGFGAELASCLAADRVVDLHALIELVERGCPPGLAARILAPLEREGPPC